jgi:hypothetical protein
MKWEAYLAGQIRWLPSIGCCLNGHSFRIVLMNEELHLSLGLMRALAPLCNRLRRTQSQKEMTLPRMNRKAYLSG